MATDDQVTPPANDLRDKYLTDKWGGDWTRRKLAVLDRYFTSYNTVLSKQPFQREYIDAFAGTGYCDVRGQGKDGDTGALLDGSARLALQATPGFHHHMFIERNASRCAQLEKLKTDFPSLANRIEIHCADANEKIKQLCARNWRARRAVLFLDPFGMQVEWETIARIAATQAIDLWLLFPLAIGIGRVLPRNGEIPPEWEPCINRTFGEVDWRRDLYPTKREHDLFGEHEYTERVDLKAIGLYFNNRLRNVFPGVASKPLVLHNSTRSPLYLLCFAAGNPRGAKIAVKIADHLLRAAA